jgi:hypothetical protein
MAVVCLREVTLQARMLAASWLSWCGLMGWVVGEWLVLCECALFVHGLPYLCGSVSRVLQSSKQPPGASPV